MTKALTLTQPWAQLVALGVKRIETRSWTTAYRGPLLIHAAKGKPDRSLELDLFRRGLIPWRNTGPAMPLGAIVAKGDLVDVVPVDQLPLEREWPTELGVGENRWPLTLLERELGNYSINRYAWLLADVVAFPRPIPARGALGLWEHPDL